jgi:beta-galactosidase
MRCTKCPLQQQNTNPAVCYNNIAGLFSRAYSFINSITMPSLSLTAFRPFCIGLLIILSVSSATAADSIRERTSLDSDWRFIKDDPADVAGQLDYAKVKGSVTQTGQDIKDLQPAQMPLPEPIKDNPGASVSYVQGNFDDSGWRQLNLPHDWGIEGPFNQA